MLDTLIKKLSVILTLCVGISLLLYFTDLGALFNGEAKRRVEKAKKEVEEKIEAKKEEIEEKIEEKKEEVEKKVEKVEKKIESNIEKVEKKVKDLKKLKLKDLID
jgi:Skp family chaperone for outer membrane proteins